MQTLPRQTKVSKITVAQAAGDFSLPGSVISPYYSGRGAVKNKIMIVKFILQSYQAAANGAILPYGDFCDISTNTFLSSFSPLIDTTVFDTKTDIRNAIYATILAESVVEGFTGFAVTDIIDLNVTDLPAAPTSYQTIVSQTGTAAPTANITPMSTYPSGTTFTWARTGAGVYTLTASTAVFSTTKTAVFISPLTNLNAQARGVVTSTTVVTFTTAIGSLLGLGLLGFTATNTDALLSNTMIYVQTYA